MKGNNLFLNLLLNSLSEQIAVINQDGVIIYVNQSWINYGVMNGMHADYEWIGGNYLKVCHNGLDDAGDPVCNTTSGILEVVNGLRDYYEAEYPCDSLDQRRWYILRATPLKGWKSKLFVISHIEITDRKIMEDKLQLLSKTDPLTGLANRKHLNDFLMVEWKRGLRSQKPMSVLLIDIDHFKQYNDRYGHIQGDDCLIKVSNIINQSVHRCSDLVARFGGEEFIIVMGETHAAMAEKVAIELCNRVREAKLPHQEGKVVTVSIGVSTLIPAQHLDEIVLLAQADKALYLAKRNGRNRVKVFTEDLLPTPITVETN